MPGLTVMPHSPVRITSMYLKSRRIHVGRSAGLQQQDATWWKRGQRVRAEIMPPHRSERGCSKFQRAVEGMVLVNHDRKVRPLGRSTRTIVFTAFSRLIERNSTRLPDVGRKKRFDIWRMSRIDRTGASMAEQASGAVTLTVVSEYADEIALEAFALHEELRHLPNVVVDQVQSDAPVPIGSKSGGAVVVGTLVASAATGQIALRQLVRVVLAWVERGRHRRILIEIDGDRIEIDGAVPNLQQLIEAFLARHE